MDVVFWNTDPRDWAHMTRYIGPYKLCHWLRKHNYTTQVIDFIVRIDEEQLYLASKKFIDHNTLVLGISTTFLSFKSFTWPDGTIASFPWHVIEVAKRLKSEFPKLKIVTGGYASEKLYMSGIPDATIMSYTTACEDILLEYVDHCKYSTPLPIAEYRPNEWYGIPTTEKTRARPTYNIARNPKYNIELDDFKWTDQDVIMPNEPLPLDISRGCIFACRFCQYPHLGKGKLDYIRGMEYIKQELLENYEKFGTTNYMILDDTFNDTEIKMRAFSDMIATLPFKITYSAYLRADLIDRFPDTAYMLKDSGLFGAFHGLESLHPHASNLVGKAWSGKRARDYIPKLYHDIWKSNVPMLLSFIIGLPKETADDIWSTVDWFESNKMYSIVFHKLGLFVPTKNTKYTIQSEFDKNPQKYGFSFDENNLWYNETWSDQTANDFNLQVDTNIRARGLRKTSIWNLGSMMAIGYDREYLLNTPLSKLNNQEILSLNTDRYAEYYRRLMNL